MSSFGEGEYDEFEFRQEVDLPSWLSSEPEDEYDDQGFVIRGGGHKSEEHTQNSIFELRRINSARGDV